METPMKLRHDVLETRNKLKSENNEAIKKYLGEEEFNKLLKLLEDVESKLGDVEPKLQEGRKDLDEEFEKSVKNGLSLLQSLFEDHQSEKAEELRENIWKSFSPWLDDEKASLIRPSKVEQIMDAVLLDDPNDKHVIAIPIIEINTSTSVAQCVYQDNRVQEAFDVKHWVCMCDMVVEHPSKLLDLLFRQQAYNNDILEKFQNEVKQKRYLLVLDGVMAKDLGFLLSDLLCDVKHGSKIIMTASSNDAFGNLNPLSMANGAPFEVVAKEQLPKAVWDMFTNTIKLDDEDEKDKKLEIGKEICIKFANHPYLLLLVASYLSTKKSVNEWDDFRKNKLTTLEDLSETTPSKFRFIHYKEFQPKIQDCERYFSLFPKDFPFQKTDLLHLWASQQDLLTEEEKPQELVGEDYFVQLQNNRLFIEKRRVRNDGTITSSYKMHDLVKTMLLEEGTKHEFCLVDKEEQMSDKHDANIQHICCDVSCQSSWEAPLWLQNSKTLHSLLLLSTELHDYASVRNLKQNLEGLTCLRALNLAAVKCEDILPPQGELKELRYLKLGISSKCLSDSVTQLLNLQTLDLRNSGIISLPKDFCTLKNLRHLYTGGKLNDLPPKFGELNNLQTLDVFIVGLNNDLATLSRMDNLVGKLTIRIEKYDHESEEYDHESDKDILKSLNLTNLLLVCSNKDCEKKGYSDRYGSLEPPPGLESITICRWKARRFPHNLIFGRTTFNTLASVHIEDCTAITNLTGLSTLPHLKFLQLWDLPELECIEGESDGSEHPKSSSSASKHYFPTLEYVTLAHLPKFVGWTRRFQQQQSPIPSQGLTLSVTSCQKMKSMVAMRSLVTLVAHNINGALLKNLLSANLGPSPRKTLKKLEIDSIIELDHTLSVSKLVIEFLTIRRCPELTKLVLESLSFLEELKIHECGKLEDITCAPDQLSSLKALEIKHCERLALINSNSETSWKCFKSISSLKLINILSLTSLENGLCSLEKLEQLSIHSIYELRALPEWIGNLKQLRQLAIRNCPFLRKLPESLGKLPSLQLLELYQCPKLKQLPNSIIQRKAPDECNAKVEGRHLINKVPDVTSD